MKFFTYSLFLGCISLVFIAPPGLAMEQPSDAPVPQPDGAPITSSLPTEDSIAEAKLKAYILGEIFESRPGLRAWFLQHVPLLCRMNLGNNGLTPRAALSQDKARIAFTTKDEPYKVYVYDSQGHEDPQVLDTRTQGVESISFRNDGRDLIRRVLISSNNGRIMRLFHCKSGACIEVLEQCGGLSGLMPVWGKDDVLLAANGNNVSVYKPIIEQPETVEHVVEHSKLAYELVGHSQPITSIDVYYPDALSVKGTIATAAQDHSIHFWDVETGACKRAIGLDHSLGLNSKLKFTATGKYLIVACDQGTLMILDASSGDIIAKKDRALRGQCTGIRCTEDNDDCFETGGTDDCTRTWDLKPLNGMAHQFSDNLTVEQAELLGAIFDSHLAHEKLNLSGCPLAEHWETLDQSIKNMLASHIITQ